MAASPFVKLALVRLVQPSNAYAPMLVTLPGMITLVRTVTPLNAEGPILVTVNPLMLIGSETAPPGPP